jgi:hypothetical protein
MKLPRPILLRIRRAIRRQTAMRPFFHRDSFTTDLDAADCLAWRQKHRPPNHMKKLFFIILAGVLTFFALGLSSCVQTTTRTVDPVTGAVVESTIKAPAPGVLPFAAAAITAYSPRPIVVREEKSIRTVTEEKSVRITQEEIDQRWRPATP